MYKKLFAIALSILFILSMGNFAALADGTENTPSLDFTDGFDTEVSLDNWSPGGNNGNKPITSIDATVTDAPLGEDFGTGTLKFDAFSSQDNGLGLNRTVQNPEPGATYVFSAWVKNAEGGVAAIGIGGYSTAAFSTWKAGDSTTTANAWVRLVCSYTLPTDGSITELTMVIRHDWDAATWVDNVHFYKYTESNPLALNDTYLQNNGFEKVITNSVKTSAENNTLVEVLHPIGWTATSNLTYSEAGTDYAVVSDDTAHSGKYSLKMKNTNGNAGWRFYRATEALEPGAYMVSAYVKIVGTPARYKNAYMYISNSPTGADADQWNQGTARETIGVQTAETASSGEWVLMRNFFILPEGNTGAHITLVCNENAFVAYFDDITVTKMNVPTVSVLDASGNTLRTIVDKTKSTEANIKFSAANNSGESSVNYTLIYALYDESGAVKHLASLSAADKTVSVTSTAGTKNKVIPGLLRESIPVTIPAGHSMKVFVFDNIGTLSSLSFASVE